MLSIMESLGFEPGNLNGVDLSPRAIELNQLSHPGYKTKVIDGYDWDIEGLRDVDYAYHTGVLCQIPQEDYPKFFARIKHFNPKYYMFIEGNEICLCKYRTY